MRHKAILLAVLILAGGLGADSGEAGPPAPHGLPGAPGPAASGTWIWSGPDPADAAAWLAAEGIAHHHYGRLGMIAFEASAAAAADLPARFGGRIDPNEAHGLHLDRSVAYIEADLVKQRLGERRSGPTVLVIDTGIDSAHPDFVPGQNLAANVQAQRSGGLVIGVLDNEPVLDRAGHGTHVASIAGGLGASLGPQDRLHGVYEGVYSIGRIAGFQASTTELQADEIRVDTVAALEAFDWALDHHERLDIRVVTNSWGTAGDLDPDHPLNRATLQLYLAGMTIVFSAGNQGDEGPGHLNKYCLPPWVLCVAAGDLQGARASFSSHGRDPDPKRPWDHPDLTAPGAFIQAARPPTQASPGTVAGNVLGGTTSDSLYHDRSGSSMAAPHVAGAAALIQAANPRLSPDQTMDILVATTSPMADDTHRVGTGYLNAREAFNLAVQTQGNRAAFLAGQEVKYAGPLVGDHGYRNSPVTQGYNGTLVAGPTIPAQAPPSWVLTPVGGILVAALVGTAVLNVLLSLRFRGRGERGAAGAGESWG